MKKINDFTYSTKPFNRYQYKLRLEVYTKNDEFDIDIYTDCPSIAQANADLISVRSKDITYMDITTWHTKKEEERIQKFIEENF